MSVIHRHLLGLVDFGALRNLAVILLVEDFQSPILELGEDGELHYLALNLLLHIVYRYILLLGAIRVLLSVGAVVIHEGFYFTSFLFYYFLFLYRGDGTPALAAGDDACKSELVRLRARLAVPT